MCFLIALQELAKDNVTLTRELYLDYNEITVVGITALAQALTTNTKSGVHVIDVSSNNIGPEGAQVLADMIHAQLSVAERVQTTRLNLARNNIGDEGAVRSNSNCDASQGRYAAVNVDWGLTAHAWVCGRRGYTVLVVYHVLSSATENTVLLRTTVTCGASCHICSTRGIT